MEDGAVGDEESAYTKVDDPQIVELDGPWVRTISRMTTLRQLDRHCGQVERREAVRLVDQDGGVGTEEQPKIVFLSCGMVDIGARAQGRRYHLSSFA